MQKISFLFILACFISPAKIFSQDNSAFVGTWEGTLKVSQELRIVIHVTKEADGILSSALDSPDQSAFGIAADSTTVKRKSIWF